MTQKQHHKTQADPPKGREGKDGIIFWQHTAPETVPDILTHEKSLYQNIWLPDECV